MTRERFQTSVSLSGLHLQVRTWLPCVWCDSMAHASTHVCFVSCMQLGLVGHESHFPVVHTCGSSSAMCCFLREHVRLNFEAHISQGSEPS